MKEQEQQRHDQRFDWIKHRGGPAVSWAESSGQRLEVVGAGLAGWWASDFEYGALGLSKHITDTEDSCLRMLELSPVQCPSGAGRVRWRSVLCVGEGRYVRTYMEAPDFPTALRQAESHVHQTKQLAGIDWFQQSDMQWVGWLGPFSFIATERSAGGWRVEADVEAPTLEEAATLAGLLAR